MKRLRGVMTGLMGLTVLAAGGGADAATLSVDPTFSDPLAVGQYRTIKDAVAAAQSGDIIQVAVGDYAEAVTITKGLTLQGSGPQFTRQNYTITINTVEPVKISGFTITAPGNGIYVTGGCVMASISNNCIIGNGGAGIELKISGALGVPSYYFNIINNTIYNNATNGVHSSTVATNSYAPTAPTIYMVNNIIGKNGAYGAYYSAAAADSTASQNDIYGNTGGTVYACGSQKDACGVPLASDNTSVDPSFVDPTQGDFTLQPSGRNKGKIGASYLNPDGTRNDQGAFGGPGAASFWPYGYGPIVTDISTSLPARVTQGGSITINATAKIR